MAKKRFEQVKRMEKLRRKPPKFKMGDKNPELLCPFCKEPHPIAPDGSSPCGTFIEVMAVQPIYHNKMLVCSRCGKSGGTMNKMGNNLYVHAFPCTEAKTEFYVEPPKMSLTAKLAWKLLPEKPNALARFLVKVIKQVPEELVKLDETGKRTNEILGYRWKKV